jgi:hypothetical protein
MRERGGGRRVGQVVGGHIDGLNRGHRARRRGGDSLLELTHLRGERRLISDGARHATEERGDLRPCLDEAEDVVDEQQDVLTLVTEDFARA